MLAVYEHLANSDQEDAVLKLHGLKNDNTQESILFSKSCPNCHVSNSRDKYHCINCGKELSKELVKLKESKREMSRKTRTPDFEDKISKKIKNLKHLFLEQQKFISKLVDEKTKIIS
ncbi:MAG: hypothetical protein OEL56_03105 [Nitrosopumilus sp.]|nr:hypothetical protein [Nitrosopumilus sp.]MDH3489414.1 hypothetical protein [Nitrosopumilus sp.]MDH3516409.1 hypothetical protein [Nitrosopumilus sp.]MDH3565395.1 hypothetical protein [Nitrosopumilus sp.]MDH5417381.1 hypothetical protein [Nitrosopumilus sp.]